MQSKFLKSIVASLAIALSSFANAGLITTIDFENGSLDPIFNYSGNVSALNGATYFYDKSGYRTMADGTIGVYGMVSYEYYYPGKTIELAITSGLFDLNSFKIAGSWGSQTVTVQGINGGGVSYETTVDIDNTQIDVLDLGWINLTSFKIIHGNNFVADLSVNANCGGCGHFVIDDIVIGQGFDHTSVPEPSTLAIFALGMIGLASRRFKKQS
ncbi:MAG: PEP-CTERM sorting domain-containing protein [Alteromonadaceae bacterium]|nr:PEP-CTERM sorting domain-containing protein [Alteromonadaceae bacterium]